MAWDAHCRGDLQQAERAYRWLLDHSPAEDDAVNLGALLRQQGRLREASAIYRQWLHQFPAALQLHLNAANCLHDLGQHRECVALLRGYLQRQPGEHKVVRALARSLTELRELGESETLLRELTRIEPNDVSSWMDLGLCLHRQDKLGEALACFERVNELDPNHVTAMSNRITMLKDAGRYGHCQNLIAQLPSTVRSNPLVRGAIATLHMATNATKAAMEELGALCWLEPNEGGHWLNLAACLRTVKHANAALTVLKRGLQRQPYNTDLQQALGQCLAELGRPDRALPVLRSSAGPMEKIKDEHLFNIQFLGAAYHLISAEELRAWARSWEERVQQERGVGALCLDVIRAPMATRRLRVGYLSADWCNHPVCRFMLPLLRDHDRGHVEVWGLSAGPLNDGVSKKAETLCDHWVDLQHATDLEAARVMADLELDVVVELGGYTGHSRLATLLHRPAPVHLSYLGYFAPTYLKSVDGWIGDAPLFEGLDPTERMAHQCWEITGGYMAYQPPENLPRVHREEGERFRFGSFNHSRKLTPETMALFSRVLKAVPASELVLKSISFVEEAEKTRVRRALIAAGIEDSRIHLFDSTDSALDHLELYNTIDVAVDAYPYGGATTTCEALVMGVPVITLKGPGMAGRLSSSILHSINAEEWASGSAEELVRVAVDLSDQGPRTTVQRIALQTQVLESDLCDSRRVSRELERIYQEACAQCLLA